jgi:hypothetical protein
MDKPSFSMVWARIKGHQGAKFLTKRGLEFTYTIDRDALAINRTNYPLTKSNFETAYREVPFDGPGAINTFVRGPAYVWAVLHDQRIRGSDW